MEDAGRRPRVAILDDYHDVARKLADWSPVEKRCDIRVFTRPLAVPEEAAQALQDFDILVTLRERMSIPAVLIERLSRLKHIVVTGKRYSTIDAEFAAKRGITVSTCPPDRTPGVGGVVELAWGLIIAAARNLTFEDRMMRQGAWQNSIGTHLGGSTLGIIGLGDLGRRMAAIGNAFGMRILAWNRSLTDEAAQAVGARRVKKDELLRQSDVVTLHVVLTESSRGLIGTRELDLMKPDAIIVNTSRGPLIDEKALIAALNNGVIGKAALDVYDVEPLPPDHPFRSMDNVVLSPHLAYYTKHTVASYYRGAVENILAILDGEPIRLANAPAVRLGA